MCMITLTAPAVTPPHQQTREVQQEASLHHYFTSFLISIKMPSLEALAEAVSAAEGGAISTIVLYPLEVIKTRIQASSKR